MIDAVLFDLGDTIIDFGIGRREAERLFRAGARLSYDHLHRRDVELPPFRTYFKTHYRIMQRAYVWSKMTRRDFSYTDVLHKAAKALGLQQLLPDIERLAAVWYKPIADTSYVDGGIRQMLMELREAGTRLAIVSNTFVPPHCLDRHLEEENLLEFFPVRIYSSEVRYRKPHPRIFEMALGELGVHPSRALFIGDLINADIFGAKRAGMRTIWKPSRLAKRIPTKPHHMPDCVIPSVTQLPQALRQFGWRPAKRDAVALVG